LVTTIAESHGTPAGFANVINVGVVEVGVTAIPPTESEAPGWIPLPWTETSAPGAATTGVTWVRTSGVAYVNTFWTVAVNPSGFVAVTFFGPSVAAGLVHAICVDPDTFTPVAGAAPKLTVAPGWKCAPV